MSYESPFSGLRVVDLSQGVAGPYCAMLLAQYGADVIKVEPHDGDWSRILGLPDGEHTAFSIAANLGKRSIALDLKQASDCESLWRLIERADVFIEGFRPGVIERLGFDYERVAARNSRILYVSISGFGQAGPLRTKPAMDPVLQAYTGFMMANQDKDGLPQRSGPIIVDMATALYAYQAVSTALYARRDLDHGRKIEVSLMEAAANLQVIRMLQTYILGHPPVAASAPSGVFHCADGYIQVISVRQRDFEGICKALELEQIAADPRFATPKDRMGHTEELNARVAKVLAEQPVAHWCERLTEAGVQNEAVLDYFEFLSQDQVKAMDLVSWLPQAGFDKPLPVFNPPGMKTLVAGTELARSPTVGQHTEEILAELGVEANRELE